MHQPERGRAGKKLDADEDAWVDPVTADHYVSIYVDPNLYGDLKAEDGHLVPLIQLVHLEQFWERKPLIPAAHAVLKALKERPDVRLYITRLRMYARRIDVNVVYGVQGSREPNGTGTEGFLRAVYRIWHQSLEGGRRLVESSCIDGGQVAVHLDDAVALYGDRFEWLKEQEQLSGPAVRPGGGAEILRGSRVVQPIGSSWPHVKGADWTDAELQALREMRQAGMTDVEIAKAAGCSRQIIGEQIGSRKANRKAAADVAVLHQLTLASSR